MSAIDDKLLQLEQAGRRDQRPEEREAAARAERQKAAALDVLAAVALEAGASPSVAAWLATKPVARLTAGLGMVMGEPAAESSRLMRTCNVVMRRAVDMRPAGVEARVERLRKEFESASPATIEALQAEVRQVASEVRSAQRGLEVWRRDLAELEAHVRESIATLSAWLADSERARGGAR
jgi:hypothetical protein